MKEEGEGSSNRDATGHLKQVREADVLEMMEYSAYLGNETMIVDCDCWLWWLVLRFREYDSRMECGWKRKGEERRRSKVREEFIPIRCGPRDGQVDAPSCFVLTKEFGRRKERWKL